MNKIYEYVRQVGCFMHGQYIGFYDDIPFTHEEWLDFLDETIPAKFDYKEEEDGIFCAVFLMGEFVLRYVAMGEEVYQLLTRKEFQLSFPEEVQKLIEVKKWL